jgi:hypothetical protein
MNFQPTIEHKLSSIQRSRSVYLYALKKSKYLSVVIMMK